MGEVADKIPEALVVGGRAEDNAVVVSRMIDCGWRVKERWLNGEFGHDFSRPPRGITMIVVMRDDLENKMYQKTCTLADLAKVPIVKWDVDKFRFRDRLQRLGLLFESPKVQEPKPAAPPMVGNETAQDIAMQEGWTKESTEQMLGRVQRVRDPQAELRAVCELLKSELETNPLFNAVTVHVNTDGTATVTPVARAYTLGTARVDASTRIMPEATMVSPAGEPASAGIMAKLEEIEKRLKALEPVPRPVAMPAPPRIELPPARAAANGNGAEKPGRHRWHKGMKLNMVCRYPGCKARSMGPKYQWHCKPHQKLSMEQKHANMKKWSETNRATL